MELELFHSVSKKETHFKMHIQVNKV
jgi:hypothetical protein